MRKAPVGRCLSANTKIAGQTTAVSVVFKWCVTDPLRTVVFTRIWLWLHKVSAATTRKRTNQLSSPKQPTGGLQRDLKDGADLSRRKRALLRAVRFVSTGGVEAEPHTNRWQSTVQIIASVEYVHHPMGNKLH